MRERKKRRNSMTTNEWNVISVSSCQLKYDSKKNMKNYHKVGRNTIKLIRLRGYLLGFRHLIELHQQQQKNTEIS